MGRVRSTVKYELQSISDPIRYYPRLSNSDFGVLGYSGEGWYFWNNGYDYVIGPFKEYDICVKNLRMYEKFPGAFTKDEVNVKVYLGNIDKSYKAKKLNSYQINKRDIIFHKFYNMSEINKDGCRIWAGYVDRLKGHGIVRFNKSGLIRAHRIAYELLVGPIPDGSTVSHKCGNKLCVNIDHLELRIAYSDKLQSMLKHAVYLKGSGKENMLGSDCFVWRGMETARVAPKIFTDCGEYVFVHRIVYRRKEMDLCEGPVKDPDCVYHICGRVTCINPDHLESSDRKSVNKKRNMRKHFFRDIKCI